MGWNESDPYPEENQVDHEFREEIMLLTFS